MQAFVTAASTDSATVIRPLPPICGGSDADLGDPATADVAAASDAQPTDQTPPAAQAGNPNGQAPAPKEPPFHTHPRFRQLIEENRGLKGQVAELAQWRQQMEAKAQQGGGITAQERAAYLQAGDAIEKVLREHPRLKAVFDLIERAPQMFEATRGVAELSRAQERAIHQQAGSTVAGYLKADGYNTSDTKFCTRVNRLIANEIIEDIPNGQARYLSGDLSVVEEAYDAIKPFLASLRREATNGVIQTKNNLSKLPPAPRGGPPGQTPPPKLEPGKEREYMASLSKRAAAMMQGAGS